MQEEVEQRTVTLIVNTAKLTERELQKAISKLLSRRELPPAISLQKKGAPQSCTPELSLSLNKPFKAKGNAKLDNT